MCGSLCEDFDHIFRGCPIPTLLLHQLSLQGNSMTYTHLPFHGWIYSNMQSTVVYRGDIPWQCWVLLHFGVFGLGDANFYSSLLFEQRMI